MAERRKQKQSISKLSPRAGLSIMEILLGFVIIGGSSAAVYFMMRQTQSQIVKTETTTGFEASLALSLKQLREVVTDVGNGGNQGICRTMDTKMNSGGVGFISVNLPASGTTDPFSPDWQRVFGTNSATNATLRKGWVPDSSDCHSSSAYQRCFKPLPKDPKDATSRLVSGLSDALMTLNPRFKFIITPVVTRKSGSTGNYAPLDIPNTSQDARDVAFLLTAQVEFENPQTKERKTQEQFSLVWMGEYRCKKVVGNKTVVLSPSAIGSGSASNGVSVSELFSATQSAPEAILQGSFLTTAYTEGFAKNGRAETQDGPAYVASAACVEHIYRCRQTSTARQWVPSIQSSILARYNPNNGVVYSASLTATPSVQVSKESGSRSIATPTEFTLDGVSVGAGAAIEFLNSPRNLKGASASGPVCPQVCTAESGYNDRSGSDPFKVTYEFSLSGSTLRPKIRDTTALGCACCYGKQCAAIGTKMVSWCEQQPADPIDARIPECSAAEFGNITDMTPIPTLSSYQPMNIQPNACLAASVSSTGKLVIEPRNCNDSLKTLCYSQGDFRVARVDGAYPTGNYVAAAQNCYNLGKETVLKDEVDDKLKDQGNYDTTRLPTATGSHYTFVNSALSGIFLAPQTEEQILSSVKALNKASAGTSGTQYYWIALRTNATSKIVAAVPEMAAQSSENIAFFDARGFLLFDRITESFDLKAAASSRTAMVLHHSPRYFGAAAVEPVQTSALSAICFNPATETFFRSSGKRQKAAEAPELCRNEGGLFYAPISPLQWINALLKTKPIDAMLPWPSRKAGETLADHSAWVALKRNSETDPWVPAFRMMSSTHLMSSWGEEIAANSHRNPTLYLCREASGIRVSNSNSGCTYDLPKDEFEDFSVLKQLVSANANFSGNGSTIQVNNAPPPPPPDSGSGSGT